MRMVQLAMQHANPNIKRTGEYRGTKIELNCAGGEVLKPLQVFYSKYKDSELHLNSS